VASLFDQLRGIIRRGDLYTGHREYDFEYDQMVSFGELVSTTIVFHYLRESGLPVTHLDARDLIKTDSTYGDARVDWDTTESLIQKTIRGNIKDPGEAVSIALTQGFIGSDSSGNTTTLGREGSDFSAAIFAWCLQAKEMTIWKDVPGVMNADPKWMTDAVCLEALSYREAIELAYYGASVIHPKTIKPLENAGITLYVKSFLNPDGPGTVIKNLPSSKTGPIFIRKRDQVLISLSTRDFSFILEEHLSQVFTTLAANRIRVNVMQNSAISFSFCTDKDPRKLPPLIDALRVDFETRYNEDAELVTIRHYDDHSVEKITFQRKVLLEQKSRSTLQLVLAPVTE
jgi:aspartate kinase